MSSLGCAGPKKRCFLFMNHVCFLSKSPSGDAESPVFVENHLVFLIHLLTKMGIPPEQVMNPEV